MSATKRPTFLLCFFLVVSTSKMVTLAQEMTLASTPTSDSGVALNDSSVDKEDIAKLLSSVFSGIGLDLATISQRKADASKAPNATTTTLDATALPNLTKLVRFTNTTGGMRFSTALESALAQQQTGANLQPLENAASTINAFLDLPKTFGTGQNIRVLVERVNAFRKLRAEVKDYLHVDQLKAIEQLLIATVQLEFTALSVPLAALAFVAANLALAAAITGLLGGIFYCVASSLAIAASISALPPGGGSAAAAAAAAAARGSTSNGTLGITQSKWFTELKQGAQKVNEPWIRFAFGQDVPVQFLTVANDLLGISGDVANLLTTPSPAYPPGSQTPPPPLPVVSTPQPAPVYPGVIP